MPSLADALDGCEVAVLHEWVDARAGSEQVFEAIAQLIPRADLYALSITPGIDLDVGGRTIATTALDTPRLRDRRGMTLPLMPTAWRALGREKYDVVISSHHAFAHTNRLAKPDGMHLSYVHAPARYVWSPEIDERGANPMLSPARRLLKSVDRKASQGVHAYSCNSSAVADRIQQFWGRTAEVIHPPVNVEYFGEDGPANPARDYILGFGRWIPYKNLHGVIEAADELQIPVKIAGRGPDASRIREAAAAATVPVELIESPSDEDLRQLYANAACLIFPTVEDFGMVPIEAQAAGTPVAALGRGGALETIAEGVSGAFAVDETPGALADAARRAMRVPREGPRKQAALFSRSVFDKRMSAWIAGRIASR